LILGIGIDICDVRRLREQLARPDDDVIAAVFSAAEIAYCQGKRFPAQHFAARFAGKEAVVKALAATGGQGMFWLDIEILPEAGGQPAVRLSGRAAELAAGLGVTRVWISLSHIEDFATAGVVLEGTGV
jgi:holo-[acyl-carrier protein] synthase